MTEMQSMLKSVFLPAFRRFSAIGRADAHAKVAILRIVNYFHILLLSRD
jgi:hypothetical protein